MKIAGLDPGLKGAIAFLSTEGECSTFDMPAHELSRAGKMKHELDGHALARLFWEQHAGHVFIEQTWSRPKDGGVIAFTFGKAYGIAIGIIIAIGIPITFVSPQKWKKALAVPAAKDGARARASQLLPQASGQWPLVKNDGRAEAALIALYGLRSLGAIANGEVAA